MILLASPVASAQSLDSLRNLLRENNPQLLALAFDYRAELTTGAQLAQLPDLEIMGGASILPVETRLGPQIARAGVTQMLPWPGTLAAMSRLADARARPLLEEAAALQLELIFQLETTYYRIVEAEATVATLQTSLRLYESLREIALARVENARGSSVEVLRSEMETNATLRRIEALRAEQALAWTEIEELVATALPRVLVVPELRALPPLPADSLFTDHPLVRIFRLREEISRQSLEMNDLEARPDFGVGVDYIVTGPRTDMEPEGNGRDAILPRVMVRVPLSKGKYDARRQEEAVRLEAIAARRRGVVNQLRAALERAVIAAADADARIAFLDRQVELTGAALDIARSEYANSRRPFDEVLRLQDELVGYRIEALAAQTTLFIQVATADRYLPRR
ncbi:TolC family protein [Lewinella sp. IMCC34183]|uniref:TolC family protein n=1 Tax=Lewinella sp. IMCC34183 TaxID=2248762 RepID=UPI0018E56939|nr:TolC family protein [Lewinella sp. IMCC34183]